IVENEKGVFVEEKETIIEENEENEEAVFENILEENRDEVKLKKKEVPPVIPGKLNNRNHAHSVVSHDSEILEELKGNESALDWDAIFNPLQGLLKSKKGQK
ncbi:8636_t:CDS:2, partial [Gigaspora rosea]